MKTSSQKTLTQATAIILAGFLPMAVCAQYHVTGQVNNVNSAPIPGTCVQIQNQTCNQTVSDTTDTLGRYNLVLAETGVAEHPHAQIPSSFQTSVFPNPASAVSIATTSAKHTHIKHVVYNVVGQEVKSIDETVEPGYNIARWNGTDSRGVHVAGGMYFVRSTDGKNTQTQKVLIMGNAGVGSNTAKFDRANYEFTPKSLENHVLETDQIEGVLSFHAPGCVAYFDSNLVLTGDSTINLLGHPNQQLTYPIGTLSSLQLTQLIVGGGAILPNTQWHPPKYPIQMYEDTTGRPAFARTFFTAALNATNSDLGETALHQVTTPYTGTEFSKLTTRYINNDTTYPLLNQDGTILWTEYDADNRPITGTIYLNTSHGNPDSTMFGTMRHEDARAVTRIGPGNFISNNPNYVFSVAVPTSSPFNRPFNVDERTSTKFLMHLQNGTIIGNYKNYP